MQHRDWFGLWTGRRFSATCLSNLTCYVRCVTTSLSYELHKLTSRLDRAADQVLQREVGITYARFLALFAVQQGARTQRELSAWLGVTEPSVSRMAQVLSVDGFLAV